MVHAARYSKFIADTIQNRRLMARIALNAAGHSTDFPVDVSELRKLSPMNRAVTNAFLNWCVVNGCYRYGGELPRLQAIARGETF